MSEIDSMEQLADVIVCAARKTFLDLFKMVNGIITVRYAPLEKGMPRAFQLGHGKRWNDKLLNKLTVTYLKEHPLSNGLMQILPIIAMEKKIFRMFGSVLISALTSILLKGSMAARTGITASSNGTSHEKA